MMPGGERQPPGTILFHGTGAGHPAADRMGSGVTISAGSGETVLIDAGDSIPRGLLRHGVDPNQIDALFLSHLHPDHWVGIPGLVMAWGLADRDRPVSLYLPRGAATFIESVLRESWLQVRPRPYRLELHEYDAGDAIEIGPFTVRPTPTTHLDRYRQEGTRQSLSRPAHSFGVEVDDVSLLFSQDLGGEDDLAGELAGRSTLVCEASHVDLARVVAMAAVDRVDRLILTHVPPSAEAEVEVFLDERTRSGSNEKPYLIVAYDGLTVPVNYPGE